MLRDLEQKMPTRLRDFIVAARTLLEGNTAESIAAVGRIVASDFRDPEGLFYLSRHLAHLNEAGQRSICLDASSPADSSVFRRWPAIRGSTRCAASRFHEIVAPGRGPASRGAVRIRAAWRRQSAGRCAVSGFASGVRATQSDHPSASLKAAAVRVQPS